MGALRLLVAVLILAAVGATQHRLAIVGGTIIDVRDGGRSRMDLDDAVVLVEDGRITAVGPRAGVVVPEGFRVLDASGGYLVPGLIDCFCTLNNQAYAHALLAMGVTAILGGGGGRRGELFLEGDPSPHVYRLEDVGYEEAETDALLDRVDELADRGTDVLLLMYRLKPGQLRQVAARARVRGMATIGELARTDYRTALACGVDAFVHTTRYSLGLAPQEHVDGVAAQPFADALDSAKWRYYRWLSKKDANAADVRDYAAAIAASRTALIPTGSLLHLHREGAVNPWHFAAAKLIDPKDINMPADPETGEQAWSPVQRDAYRALAANTDRIERVYRAAGCRYLAGSATDVWGTMPGISLHTELEFLVSIGSSPREALAAATSNPARVLRLGDTGEIRPGATGDVLVLDADPRVDIGHLRRIRHVVQRGAVLVRERLLRGPGADDGELVRRTPWSPTAELRAEHEHLDRVDVASIRYVSSALEVEGYLAVPKGDGPFPCIVDVRGGNREFGAIGDYAIANRLARVASWGYVVIASQYRGVAGGDGIEQFGGREVDDVLRLLDVLEHEPKADTERVGLYAGSRGGMTALLMLRRTDRFRACVLRAPLTDLVRWKRERPGIESVFRDLIPGYTPGRDDLLRLRSGALWADQLCTTTPILILQGTADWRVSPGMTLAFADALQRAGRRYELQVFDGADHGLRPRRRDARALARAWFDRFVRK